MEADGWLKRNHGWLEETQHMRVPAQQKRIDRLRQRVAIKCEEGTAELLAAEADLQEALRQQQVLAAQGGFYNVDDCQVDGVVVQHAIITSDARLLLGSFSARDVRLLQRIYVGDVIRLHSMIDHTPREYGDPSMVHQALDAVLAKLKRRRHAQLRLGKQRMQLLRATLDPLRCTTHAQQLEEMLQLLQRAVPPSHAERPLADVLGFELIELDLPVITVLVSTANALMSLVRIPHSSLNDSTAIPHLSPLMWFLCHGDEAWWSHVYMLLVHIVLQCARNAQIARDEFPLVVAQEPHQRRRSRRSLWATENGEETFLGKSRRQGERAFDGMARWLGVRGDEDELAYRQQQYNYTKAMGQTLHRRNKTLTKAQEDMLELAAEEDDSSDHRFDPEKADHQTTRDPQQGWEHYVWLHEEELRKIVKPGWFGGQEEKTKHRRKSRFNNDTLVQAQLQALPEYTPVFINAITTLQIIIMILVLAHAYTTDYMAPFAFKNERNTCGSDSSPACLTFNGSSADVTRVTSANPGYGPSSIYLAKVGAKFAPCMREDESVTKAAIRTRTLECGNGRENPCEGNADDGTGCCTLGNGQSGQTTEAECASFDGTWVNDLCDETEDFITWRPCCGFDLVGSCQLTTEDTCAFLNGYWHMDAQLCSNVLCLKETCTLFGTGTSIDARKDFRNLPDNPSQWWRFITPLFFHASVAHAILVLIAQYYYGRKMETHIGAMRSLLIYFISGIGGTCIAAVFSPLDVSVGTNPSVYGILAVHLVDLFQSWQLVDRPGLSLAGLGGVIAVLLLVGTTSYVDNWSHIGGFAFGLVSGIIFIPYITFGKWDLARKRLLLFICAPLLLVMFVAAFVTFYQIQNTEFCSWCDYLNCVPYADGMCGRSL
ncbi:uncharacterized protein MONBRDRAFT_27089 [Monosiga brevicollis MX1]|uniref:Peptidase S54 rhomboid domain-containing protein n=1 Tax=Monosiga brevicollis TaxID=81824 RepID=A9V498_MONBE|nr:uncharacterized protein MONBRDRAFT_27089 [Monosiga brevicollis MX1]EDQ87669.1 predicted protein [Monosiga brevicollis MX1]|eukprot:XP_001747589.1 hypothetical protein [Monosiga brevicollis MX1]